MIKHYRNETIFGHLFWITITYVAAHWFLLVATGRWWDDWVYADKNWNYLFEVMRQSSLPLSAIVDGSNWLFPDGFYRVLVFTWYYISTVIFYMILKKVVFFRDDACFWITMFFVTVPVFDARILWIMYPYAIGMPLFLGGFYIAICNEDIRTKNGIIKRIISLVLLMLSYCFLQSVMLFAIPLVLYLCFLNLKNERDLKNIIKGFIKVLFHYVDYLIEPIIWYFGSKWLFPGYGEYGRVYYVDWYSLPAIILNSPRNGFITLKGIFMTYLSTLRNSHLAMFAVTLAFGIYITRLIICLKNKQETEKDSNSFIYNFLMASLGFVLFFLAFFPYAVKRNSALSNVYKEGRDSVLLGIGTAIILYYCLHLFLRRNILKMVMISLILLGIIHFNYMYLDWQESYYQQVQLQHEFASNQDIIDNDTFLVMYRGALICHNYYQTNGNSWTALGDQKRLYMAGTNDLSWFANETEQSLWSLKAFMMNEYDYGDRIIDGIIFVDYSDIGRREIIRQKFNELFYKNAFDSWIDEIKNVKYVPITKEESDNLLKLHAEGKLSDNMVYEMYY